jgi:glycerol kinase
MFGTIDSWLLWHLTEERRCLSTPTNATSAGAYQLRDHRYYAPWLAELAFPSGLLPTLVDDGEMLGTSRKSVLGIAVPVLACMGDQFAGAVGLGCIARSILVYARHRQFCRSAGWRPAPDTARGR